ncbi:hypothetical protein U7230_07055 [Carboxydochorda subterranea]|uniref:Uncharacterized protein n=1 Tax=Carboxydichorda subterranea TaxID=3109565 RepID=A0ABZ1C0W3_9FIRM|nr:hypothetical protein [Limnochorda sp. L945t]WRP18744.1 hypothetical protein U7230_07055 [Limnochorda sp. L945t]
MGRDGNPRLQARLPIADYRTLQAALDEAGLDLRAFLSRLAAALRAQALQGENAQAPEKTPPAAPAELLVEVGRLLVERDRLKQQYTEYYRRWRRYEQLAEQAEQRLREAEVQAMVRGIDLDRLVAGYHR